MRATLASAGRHGRPLVARRSRPGAGGPAPLAGVLVGVPPGGWPLSLPPLLARLRCVLAQGPRVAARWREVAETLHAGAPPAPHWVLATLGVEPSLRGCGIGRTLLAHWLAQVDADRAPAYLETDAPRNLPLYERAGFRATQELRIFDVPVWRMRRAAVGSEA
jgi:GNAT superfamily N-acetyltransferase